MSRTETFETALCRREYAYKRTHKLNAYKNVKSNDTYRHRNSMFTFADTHGKLKRKKKKKNHFIFPSKIEFHHFPWQFLCVFLFIYRS